MDDENRDYDDDNKDVGNKGVKQVDEVTSSHSESSDEEA